MANTGLKAPTGNGSRYNTWTNPTNAYSADGTNFATRADSTTTRYSQDYSGFGFNIPAGSTINGIEVVITGKYSRSGGGYLLHVKSNPAVGYPYYGLTTTNTEYTIGSPTEKWGLSWTVDDLSDANFYVALSNPGDYDGETVSMDCVNVRVYYTLPSMGGEAGLLLRNCQ